MLNKTITCPVSGEIINESVARIAAFLTIVITSISVFFKLPLVLLALSADFALRAFTNGRYSPVKYLSKYLFNYSGLATKRGDAAPKKFAAAMGFLFSLVIAVLQLANYYLLADVVAAILLICAALEAFAGFCAGCVIYTYLVLSFVNSKEEPIKINL